MLNKRNIPCSYLFHQGSYIKRTHILMLAFIFCLLNSYILKASHSEIMIIDSIEVKKQKAVKLINAISDKNYVPVNYLDKKVIENIKAYYAITKICKKIEKEVTDEKLKPSVIIDTPVRNKMPANINPIG